MIFKDIVLSSFIHLVVSNLYDVLWNTNGDILLNVQDALFHLTQIWLSSFKKAQKAAIKIFQAFLVFQSDTIVLCDEQPKVVIL